MKISVIIPAYNEEQCLPETLKRIGEALSIAACTSEIIMIDNDSQDGTKRVAEVFGAKVYAEKVHNISKVRNTGAKNSTGDVLIFIDADTLVPNALFQKIAAVMEDEKCLGGAVAVAYEAFERKWMKFYLLGKVMKQEPQSCQLISPADAEAWAAYHRIRRTILFENRGRFDVYDPHHPDEFKAGNYPKLLMHGTDYIGVVRIDLAINIAYLRRVAIDEPWQRKGFGRVMIRLAEQFARDHGARRIESIVAADATLFYDKCGYQPIDPIKRRISNVHMYKDLAPA